MYTSFLSLSVSAYPTIVKNQDWIIKGKKMNIAAPNNPRENFSASLTPFETSIAFELVYENWYIVNCSLRIFARKKEEHG